MVEWLKRAQQAKRIPVKRSAAQIVRDLRDTPSTGNNFQEVGSRR
jgi:hypothetical protein